MKKIAENIGRFLLSNTVWIFFTGVCFTSIILVVQNNQHEWGAYLWHIGMLSLLFAPVLSFCGFRQWFRKQLPIVPFLLLWFFCFIAYPYLLEALGWHEFIAPSDMGKVAVRNTGTWFLAAELAIQLNNYWLKGKVARQWAQRMSLEKGILLLAAVFAVFYAALSYTVPGNPIREASITTLASYTFQIYIILLVYYLFYWINHYVLINRILKEKGALFYSFGFVATIVLFYPVAAQFIAWLPMVRQTNIHPVNNGLIFEDINALVPFFGMLFSIPFILAIKWFRQSSEMAALAREKSETELNLLKQQINPHFFFNTLNNLYALSITNDRQTPEVILQLSELMRYVIYRGKEETVELAEEVKYIEDYVRLQQIRLHKQLNFRFDKEIDDEKLPIPPLMFITLVENAFKHGIEPAEGASFLHIHLKSEDDGLVFSCANSLEDHPPETGGIGLNNLRRRLELRFPGQHRFEVEQKAGSFNARLQLGLSMVMNKQKT